MNVLLSLDVFDAEVHLFHRPCVDFSGVGRNGQLVTVVTDTYCVCCVVGAGLWSLSGDALVCRVSSGARLLPPILLLCVLRVLLGS